jgi:hypothetical protein
LRRRERHDLEVGVVPVHGVEIMEVPSGGSDNDNLFHGSSFCRKERRTFYNHAAMRGNKKMQKCRGENKLDLLRGKTDTMGRFFNP